MKLAVTGATGYIGTGFIKRSCAAGHEVVALSRRFPSYFSGIWIPYDLASTQTLFLPPGTEAVLHLAVSDREQDGGQDIAAVERLIAATQKASAKLIFVSSQTARPDAPTAYGRNKWQIEQIVLSSGGWVVRPGQVYGGELRGLFGVLVNAVRKLPLLPIFLPTPKVQPIHVEDLSEGLLRIAVRKDLPSAIYCLADSEPLPFHKFLNAIAKSRLHCKRGFVPVPVIIINMFTLVLSEALCIRLGLKRFRSLFALPIMETASDLMQLELILRPLHTGMHRSGNHQRRLLLQEGQALFSYVLREPPSAALLRRYAKAIETLREGMLLALPKLFVRYPTLLALAEGTGNSDMAWSKEFIWRLNGATILAEATPQGARRFLGLGERHSFERNLINIVRTMASEIGWKMISILLLPLIRNALTRSLGEQPR